MHVVFAVQMIASNFQMTLCFSLCRLDTCIQQLFDIYMI